MLRTFNCGIGMILIADSGKAHEVLRVLGAAGEEPIELGEVVKVKTAERFFDNEKLDL
jgi:phosphoribosylformylglycinamidine cyclo-ligase